MKKKLFWGLTAVIVLALTAFVAYRVYTHFQEAGSKKKQTGKAAVAVQTVNVIRDTIRDNRTFTGTLKPWSLFTIAPKVPGRLESIDFDIGDRIEGGAVIARIDDVEYRQGVEQAQADLDVALAQKTEAEVVLDLRRREFERQTQLTEKKVGSQAQYESAMSSFRAQQAAFQKCEADVKRNQAILDNARLKLHDCTVKATWSKHDAPRYVGLRYVDSGALLSANEAILTVGELDRLFAVIYVIERDYPHVRQGQEASISTDAYPGVEFKGKVERIAQLLQDNTRQAAVRIEIPNADLRLKPGMYVRVELTFATHPEAQIVPRNALVKRDGKQGIFEVLPDRTARFVPVQAGIADGDQIEIQHPQLTRPIVTIGNHLLSQGVEVVLPRETEKGE